MLKIFTFSLCLFAVSCAVTRADPVTYPDITEHEAMFAYCVGNFGPRAVGNVFCEWALRNGFPIYSQTPEERSCVKAFNLGMLYSSPLPTGDPPVDIAALCAQFVKTGPSLIPDW